MHTLQGDVKGQEIAWEVASLDCSEIAGDMEEKYVSTYSLLTFFFQSGDKMRKYEYKTK